MLGELLLLAVVYFVYQAGSLGVGYWLPQIVKDFSSGLSNTAVGFLSATPYVLAAVGMVWWSRRSDRLGERKLHSAIPPALAAITLCAAGFVHSPVLGMSLIALSLTGMYSFESPYAIGWAKDSTGSATGGLMFLGGLTAVACVLTFAVRAGSRLPAEPRVPGEAPRPTLRT